jgi:hypothetical protein
MDDKFQDKVFILVKGLEEDYSIKFERGLFKKIMRLL